MVVTIAPRMTKLMMYIELALSGFENLDKDTAIYECKKELNAMKRYLETVNSANDCIPMLSLEGGEFGIGFKGVIKDNEFIN